MNEKEKLTAIWLIRLSDSEFDQLTRNLNDRNMQKVVSLIQTWNSENAVVKEQRKFRSMHDEAMHNTRKLEFARGVRQLNKSERKMLRNALDGMD